MSEPTVRLKCSTCGSRPTELEAKYTAKLGGTHYRRLDHAAGIPGNRGNRVARTCGTWVAVGAPRSDRDFPGVPDFMKKP